MIGWIKRLFKREDPYTAQVRARFQEELNDRDLSKPCPWDVDLTGWLCLECGLRTPFKYDCEKVVCGRSPK